MFHTHEIVALIFCEFLCLREHKGAILCKIHFACSASRDGRKARDNFVYFTQKRRCVRTAFGDEFWDKPFVVAQKRVGDMLLAKLLIVSFKRESLRIVDGVKSLFRIFVGVHISTPFL